MWVRIPSPLLIIINFLTFKFCSHSCASSFKGKKLLYRINKEELSKLVWEMPTSELAKLYGCSDTALSKFCKKFNISKPPRGYWTKLYFTNNSL